MFETLHQYTMNLLVLAGFFGSIILMLLTFFVAAAVIFTLLGMSRNPWITKSK